METEKKIKSIEKELKDIEAVLIELAEATKYLIKKSKEEPTNLKPIEARNSYIG
jgi:hypothetical protein